MGLDFPASTPHEKYEFAFRRLGLETTALGYQWITASGRALDRALPIQTPHNEVGYFDPNAAESLGFQLTLRRGQRLLVSVEVSGQLFIDLFRVREDSLAPHQHVHHADSGVTTLDYFVRRTGDYVVRLQPELLAGGRYEITITDAASLTFPVAGAGMDNIRSVFGDARDGGRRQHHGVDIFAPRGTPVVAGAAGTVRSTRGSRLGGKVVWLRTQPAGSLYYAHLDSVVVRRGMQVEAGDTVGFVGNTGNARSTPPHLHFGVYSGGPNDPGPYLRQPTAAPAPLVADASLVGTTVRSQMDANMVRVAPNRRAEAVTEAGLHTPMRVLGGTGDWFRVELPNRATGFVRAASVELGDTPVGNEVIARRGTLLDSPSPGASVMDDLDRGVALPVLGRYGGYALVVAGGTRRGWVAETDDLWVSGAETTVVAGDGGQEQ